jgi:CIC family chloride channel protein
MGGLVSGVLHAPLTGIFLIAEISGGYALFVPLMIVSATSFFVMRYFEPNSIYTKKLIEQGLIGRDKDADVLSEMSMGSIIEDDFSKVHPDQTLRELIEVIAASKRNIFVVLSKDNVLEGIIMIDDIREIMFNTNLYDYTLVRELMSIPVFIANMHNRMEELMVKFEEYSIWTIPVVDDAGRYLGFISKSAVLDKYREKLLTKSEAIV